jgi:peptidoglycan/LPS O-acetylase OafA/YrhL
MIELEALRGIAAIIVLIHHFMLAFTPRLHGLLYPQQPHSIFGTPLFAFVNGSAAVILFFVLSGFVLTVRIFENDQLANGVVAVLKRWPRLAPTVMISNLFAGALMAEGFFLNHSVATQVQSIWLSWFYQWPSTGTSEIGKAVWQGATTFFTGESTYNSNLWTMYYEFVGSLVAIGGAAISLRVPPHWRSFFLILVFAVVFYKMPLISPFVAGIWLALRHTVSRPIESTWLSVLAPFLIIGLDGYHENLISHQPEGWYAFLNPVVAISPIHLRVALHTASAVALLMMFLYVPVVRRLMSGTGGARLGFMSFAIYLVQIPIICSASAWTFQRLSGLPHLLQLSVTFAVTLAGTILVAIPLAIFDRWWMRTVNKGAVQITDTLPDFIAAKLRRR